MIELAIFLFNKTSQNLFHTFTENLCNLFFQGKEKVEGLFLENPADVSLTHEEFSGFQNLRLLKLVDTNLEGNFELLLSKLKWFSWHCCPSHFTMVNLSLKKLVVLDLSQSSINENWAGWSLIQVTDMSTLIFLLSDVAYF